jgi:hypothetical protein
MRWGFALGNDFGKRFDNDICLMIHVSFIVVFGLRGVRIALSVFFSW